MSLQCILPREVQDKCDQFKTYYMTAHTGRRLTWQTNMGNADVKGHFGGGKRRYELSERILWKGRESPS
jgi:cullin 3